ncbi:MAG: hypothetical protein HWD61_14360 [Parachlamydiaceae bacterium]|nr:MAG: hypothetical protein HWD61_14360 [Parachlamydiaceae bacterium]
MSKISSQDLDETNGINNEIAVKHRIEPHYIRGFNTPDPDGLIAAFREAGLITTNENGEEIINGKPLKQFIFSDWQFQPEMWK